MARLQRFSKNVCCFQLLVSLQPCMQGRPITDCCLQVQSDNQLRTDLLYYGHLYSLIQYNSSVYTAHTVFKSVPFSYFILPINVTDQNNRTVPECNTVWYNTITINLVCSYCDKTQDVDTLFWLKTY